MKIVFVTLSSLLVLVMLLMASVSAAPRKNEYGLGGRQNSLTISQINVL